MKPMEIYSNIYVYIYRKNFYHPIELMDIYIYLFKIIIHHQPQNQLSVGLLFGDP